MVNAKFRKRISLRDLVAMKKPFVFTVFGSPFVLTHVPELTSYIVTHDISRTVEC